MATLDNFHTNNGSRRPLYPTLNARLGAIQKGLYDGNMGDIPNRIPIGPIQPVDAGMRISAHADPTVTERLTQGMGGLFVPTRPYTHRLLGDTVDGIYLYTPTCLGNKMRNYISKVLPIKTTSRFAPY